MGESLICQKDHERDSIQLDDLKMEIYYIQIEILTVNNMY
jgi:hypothetical protein